ncbi:MAG: SprT family zinc-dependent metalloprotease [Pseudomonadota bacterium]
MYDKLLIGNPPITLHLRRSGRARRLSLRISQLDGRVTLTLPAGLSDADAVLFAQEKEHWIRKHLADRGADVVVQQGAEIPIAGDLHVVVPGTGRGVRTEAKQLHVPGPPDRVGARVAGHLKALANLRLAEASTRYSAQLGRPYQTITLRDTRSRWGSCTTEGRLMYSWRLIMAPPDVLDYVAAHEVAHLAELNHGPAFWAHVGALYGDHAPARKWLRKEGGSLHRYRFS